MSENFNQVGTARIAIVTAAVVIVIAGMREAAAIIVPFLVAIFIATASLLLTNMLVKNLEDFTKIDDFTWKFWG